MLQLAAEAETKFAARWGYASYSDLIAVSEPITADNGALWYATPLTDGHWLCWHLNTLRAEHLFDSFEEALQFVKQSALG